jgi:hypothetical protein
VSLGNIGRFVWIAPAALYLCLALRLSYLYVFRHTPTAFDALGIMSLPSSLAAHALTSLFIGQAHGSGAAIGSFLIMAACGVVQYLILGFILREAFERFD